MVAADSGDDISNSDDSEDSDLRYGAQLLLPEVGSAGQAAFGAARVGIIGAGGVAAPVLAYLTGAGVGAASDRQKRPGVLRVIDSDVVDLSNLQRQTLFSEADLGRAKAEAACARLHAINPHVQCEARAIRLDQANGAALIADLDLIIDATDTYATRRLCNHLARRLGAPLIFASAAGLDGQAAFLLPGRGNRPCYACLFPVNPEPAAKAEDPPLTSRKTSVGATLPPIPGRCDRVGVLGPTVGLVGAFAALLALRTILQQTNQTSTFNSAWPRLDGATLWLWSGAFMEWRALTATKANTCPECGT